MFFYIFQASFIRFINQILGKKTQISKYLSKKQCKHCEILEMGREFSKSDFKTEINVVITIIYNIVDKNKKKQILFKCYKNSDFILKKAKKLIQVVFFEVGKKSLFDFKYHQYFPSLAL